MVEDTGLENRHVVIRHHGFESHSVCYFVIMKLISYRSVLSLRTGQKQFGGRNKKGQITVRHRGGGHKQAYRFID